MFQNQWLPRENKGDVKWATISSGYNKNDSNKEFIFRFDIHANCISWDPKRTNPWLSKGSSMFVKAKSHLGNCGNKKRRYKINKLYYKTIAE